MLTEYCCVVPLATTDVDYDAHALAVRSEYRHVTDDLRKLGRGQFLLKLLSARRFYLVLSIRKSKVRFG